MSAEPSFLVSLISGGIAGTTVDVALFPLDTIKTRLQSPQGFLKSGGFRGVYKGLSAAAAGSAPGAALFFSTYETGKQLLAKHAPNLPAPAIHMIAASVGETAACMVRVPTETVKQRMQAGMVGYEKSSFVSAVQATLRREGILGFYTGFGITLMREIPFSLVQFPLYEYMKSVVSRYRCGGEDVGAGEAAICGSISGAIAAAATTPLDVIKTRLMLGADIHGKPYHGACDTYVRVLQEGRERLLESSKVSSTSSAAAGAESATRALVAKPPFLGAYSIFFSGVGPRVTWISIGGFVFFGAYEQAKHMLLYLQPRPQRER
jgi:solute carrier family 25 S-adenosylmethionine transporter 26